MPITPDELANLIASSGPRNRGGTLSSIFDPPADTIDSSGIDLRSLGLGAGGLVGSVGGALFGSGGGSKLNPNTAGTGQHANIDLGPKLTEAKGVDQQLTALITAISQAISTNQTLLLASPQTSGLVQVGQSALSDLQSAQSALEGSFWNGTNFGSFEASTAAWNAMDQAEQAAKQKMATYGNVPNQLAGGVAQAQQAQNAAAAQAAQQQATVAAQAAAAQQQLASAQNKVRTATLNANALASSGDFTSALATLSDPSVVAAASQADLADVLSSAVTQIGAQQRSAAKVAADAAAAKAASDAQAAAAMQAAQQQAQIAAQQSQAQATVQQSQIDFQKFQAQLAADAAQRQADAQAAVAEQAAQDAADRKARQDQLDRLQLLLTAAPILGKDVVAAAFANELGIDTTSAAAAADQAGAGTMIDASGAVGQPFTGFTAESF